MDLKPRSKTVSVTFQIQEIQNDPYFFKLPGEISEPNAIKELVLKRYHTDIGIMEGLVDANRLVLQWYPESVDRVAEGYHADATALLKKKSFQEALKILEQALALNNQDVDYLYKIGLIHFELKQFKESIDFLEQVTQICPIHYRAFLLLGINWIKLRKLEKAENFILESQRLKKSSILAYLNLGAIYSVQRRYNEAIEMFNSALQMSPKEARAFLGLARLYSMLNDMETSNSYFTKVIEINPQSKLAEIAKRSIHVKEKPVEDNETDQSREEQFSRGMGYFLNGNYHEASSQYKRYLQSNPSDDYGWYLLGETKIRTNELEEAGDCIKRAIRLNGKRGIYYKTLGIVFHYLGRSKEGIEVLKKAIEIGKKDSLTWTVYGIALMRQQKIEDALKCFQTALKKNPNSPLAQYHLALAYIQRKENDQAAKLLNQIISYEFYIPLKHQARTALKQLGVSY